MHRLRYLIGVLTLAAAIVAAVWFVRILRNLDDRPGLALRVEFKDARGLRDGADVRFRGVTVGTVRSVSISGDGDKAVAQLLLDPAGAAHACVNSQFWIVTPRFGGLTGGASGLDTLVRDSYIAFQTPAERGSPLAPASLLNGSERPPAEAESLEDLGHGDLLMTLLVPENHGLKPGAAVIFRGMQTGDVRKVQLAPAGTHVELTVRITRAFRQTVTEQTQFWVARPSVSGALFSGFTLTDASAIVSPYVSYYTEPGRGGPVQDGYRTAAQAQRPQVEVAGVPANALVQPKAVPHTTPDDVVLVRITYDAVERDTFSPDDPVHRQGTGTLFLDRSGRAVVVTARSLVDGSYTEHDTFGGAPDIADEKLEVLLPDGLVRRAGRVWVDPQGADLAALVIEDAPPDLGGTAGSRFASEELPAGADGLSLRSAGPDGAPLNQPLTAEAKATADLLGAAVMRGGSVHGVFAFKPEAGRGDVVAFARLPADLRPR
ncbi:MAG: MCE family protein [Planctomycetes bacterium]|nr:MCE family protein [Planctomycetota bacterium]